MKIDTVKIFVLLKIILYIILLLCCLQYLCSCKSKLPKKPFIVENKYDYDKYSCTYLCRDKNNYKFTFNEKSNMYNVWDTIK